MKEVFKLEDKLRIDLKLKKINNKYKPSKDFIKNELDANENNKIEYLV